MSTNSFHSTMGAMMGKELLIGKARGRDSSV